MRCGQRALSPAHRGQRPETLRPGKDRVRIQPPLYGLLSISEMAEHAGRASSSVAGSGDTDGNGRRLRWSRTILGHSDLDIYRRCFALSTRTGGSAPSRKKVCASSQSMFRKAAPVRCWYLRRGASLRQLDPQLRISECAIAYPHLHTAGPLVRSQYRPPFTKQLSSYAQSASASRQQLGPWPGCYARSGSRGVIPGSAARSPCSG